jgi:hypothetical protein
MAAADPSRLERMRDYLIDRYQEITIANGFRQEVGTNVIGYYQDIRETQTFPQIQVYFGEMRFEKEDSGWKEPDIIQTVYVVGHVKSGIGLLSGNTPITNLQNEVYKMMEDLSLKTFEFVDPTVKANDATIPFVFDFNRSPPRIFAVPDFKNLDRVAVFCTYVLKLRNVVMSTMT